MFRGIVVAYLFLGSVSWSQNAQLKVKDIDMADEQDTTISVRKGVNHEIKYEITEGQEDLTGDPDPLKVKARKKWLSACSTWKQETKELNKNNDILSLNCGNPDCTSNEGETICHSVGKYKLKVRMN